MYTDYMYVVGRYTQGYIWGRLGPTQRVSHACSVDHGMQRIHVTYVLCAVYMYAFICHDRGICHGFPSQCNTEVMHV